MLQDEALEAEGARPDLAGEGSDVHEEANVPEEGMPSRPDHFTFRNRLCPAKYCCTPYKQKLVRSESIRLLCAVEYCVAPPPPCLPNIATSVAQQKGFLGQVRSLLSFCPVISPVYLLLRFLDRNVATPSLALMSCSCT